MVYVMNFLGSLVGDQFTEDSSAFSAAAGQLGNVAVNVEAVVSTVAA